MLDVAQGRHDDAAQRLERLRPLIEHTVEAQWVAPVAEAAAELALWQGRPLDARAEIRAAFERLPTDTPRARHANRAAVRTGPEGGGRRRNAGPCSPGAR